MRSVLFAFISFTALATASAALAEEEEPMKTAPVAACCDAIMASSEQAERPASSQTPVLPPAETSALQVNMDAALKSKWAFKRQTLDLTDEPFGSASVNVSYGNLNGGIWVGKSGKQQELDLTLGASAPCGKITCSVQVGAYFIKGLPTVYETQLSGSWKMGPACDGFAAAEMTRGGFVDENAELTFSCSKIVFTDVKLIGSLGGVYSSAVDRGGIIPGASISKNLGNGFAGSLFVESYYAPTKDDGPKFSAVIGLKLVKGF